MLRGSALAIAATTVLIGCAGPGYQVKLEVQGIAPAEREQIAARVDRHARKGGFEVHWDHRQNDPPFFPGYTSHYFRRRSQTRHDEDEIYVFYWGREDKLEVEVMNLMHGLEPPVKADLDALADRCLEDMSAIVGSVRVRVTRERTGIPGFGNI